MAQRFTAAIKACFQINGFVEKLTFRIRASLQRCRKHSRGFNGTVSGCDSDLSRLQDAVALASFHVSRIGSMSEVQTGELSGCVLCDACNLASGRITNISPPRMCDTDNPLQGGLYENLFAVAVPCDDQKCGSHVLVLAPKIVTLQSRRRRATETEPALAVWGSNLRRQPPPKKPFHPLDLEITAKTTPPD